MKLRNKLVIAQLCVFLVIMGILLMALPELVYRNISVKDREDTMILNEQIMSQLDQNFDELVRFTKIVAEEPELIQKIDQYMSEPNEANNAKISLFLSQLGVKNKIQSYGIIGIYLDVQKADKIYDFSTVGFSNKVKEHICSEVKELDLKGKKTSFLNPFAYDGESDTAFGNIFNMAYGYTMEYIYHGQKGNLTVIASFDQLYYIANQMKDYSNDYLFLDKNNQILQPSVKETQIDVNATLKNMKYGKSYKEGYWQQKDGITTVRFSEEDGWKIICRQSRKDILDNNRSLIFLVEILILCFGFGIVLVMIPIVNHFTGPLTDVSKQMNEIAEGNLDARIEVNSTDEIGEVGASFNVMAKRLQENIVEMVEQEKREQQLKYGLMISQVDPHFIYNTMNMITYLAQKNRNEDVIAVNKAMIQILRDRLRIEVDNVYDTVEQEIKVVREYLLIQKYRYTGIFKSVIDIEAGVESYLIAKNILQPLVENAFFHGILCNTDEEGEVIDGCITIRIRMEEDKVEIIVKDNGAGMSQDKLDELSKPQRKLSSMERGEHIGIKNIKERLDYIYENQYRFQIWSKEGEGTIVTIRIPAIVSSEIEK